MINITRLASGALLIQRDATEIVIDAAAVGTAIGPVLVTLIDTGKVIGQARRESYEMGLAQGIEQGRIEAETRARIEARETEDALTLLRVGATLAA